MVGYVLNSFDSYENVFIKTVEATAAYNPWGKPGAGAPIRDVTGNVVADYKIRKVSISFLSES